MRYCEILHDVINLISEHKGSPRKILNTTVRNLIKKLINVSSQDCNNIIICL